MHDRLVNLLGATGLAVADLASEAVGGAGARNPSWSAALITLARERESETTTTDLARHIKLTQPAASRLVEGLVAQGLIERGVGSGRSVPLRLTSEGEATVDRLLAARRQALASLVARLDDDESAALEHTLEKLLDSAFEQVRSGFVLCRQCDHNACVGGGASCPVTQAGQERQGRQERGEQP
jgi:MarR family transcriptional repressor of emrRAB